MLYYLRGWWTICADSWKLSALKLRRGRLGVTMQGISKKTSTSEWRARDRQYLHPFTDHKALGVKGTRIITSAEGVYITDSDGNRHFSPLVELPRNLRKRIEETALEVWREIAGQLPAPRA